MTGSSDIPAARRPAASRKALLDGLRSGHRQALEKAAPGNPAGAPAPAPRQRAFDFSELPELRQLRMHRAAADMIGLANPFFRPQAGNGGATTTIDGRTCDNFSSYNYLGFNGHPAVAEAARAALATYGTSATASRIVAGERPIHRELEAALADLHGTEDAVVMVSGHATNVTVIGHLIGPQDLVVTDQLIHNSVSEGARLSGAHRLTFPHGDLEALDALLATHRHAYRRVLIVVEGIYSMDGDFPDLRRLVALKSAHDCWLMVDEAHAVGVLGDSGRGLAEASGVDPGAVEIWMGTLSKTLAACGGYVAGSRALCDYLRATTPGFVFSVGLSPVLAAAALASCRLLRAEPERVRRLQANGRAFLAAARGAGLDTGPSAGLSVVPVIVGDSIGAATLSNRLLERGVNALPIIFPAVAEKSARIRFFITSEHSAAQIERAVAITAEELTALREAGVGFRTLVETSRATAGAGSGQDTVRPA